MQLAKGGAGPAFRSSRGGRGGARKASRSGGPYRAGPSGCSFRLREHELGDLPGVQSVACVEAGSRTAHSIRQAVGAGWQGRTESSLEQGLRTRGRSRLWGYERVGVSCGVPLGHSRWRGRLDPRLAFQMSRSLPVTRTITPAGFGDSLRRAAAEVARSPRPGARPGRVREEGVRGRPEGRLKEQPCLGFPLAPKALETERRYARQGPLESGPMDASLRSGGPGSPRAPRARP